MVALQGVRPRKAEVGTVDIRPILTQLNGGQVALLLRPCGQPRQWTVLQSHAVQLHQQGRTLVLEGRNIRLPL